MPSAIPSAPVSKSMLWCGRIVSALVVLFLLFDGVTKVMKVPAVMQAAARLGFPANLLQTVGIILLACTAVYVIPRTSTLGAILLTGYLGGATVTNVRANDPVFETLFPVIFGVLVWGGLYLREERLRALIPLRR
ncbi:MAG: DoxX family protein [Candidatus Acidiferrales bacterium]